MRDHDRREIPLHDSQDSPASLMQLQFWLLNRMDPASAAYHVPSLSLIEGELDSASLERAFNAVTRRHRIFRSVFAIDRSGTLMQRALPWQRSSLPVIDLRNGQDGAVEEERAEQAALEEIRRPFDLASGPLLRFRLFRTAERSHLLVVTAHHIIFDLATKDLLAEELAAEYEAALSGRLDVHGVETAAYAAFSSWQERWLQGNECRKMESAWRDFLAGMEPGLPLPADRPTAAGSPRRGSIVPVRVPAEEHEKLRSFCREGQVTPFLVLLTAWARTLARESGRKKICIGVPFTNRRRSEDKQTRGCFVNILPLPFDMTDDPPAHESLRRVRRSMLQMHRMQEVPYYRLVQMMRHDHAAGENPLFQAGFTFEHPMRLQLRGLNVKAKYAHPGGAQLDLFATFWEEDDALVGRVEFDSGRFALRTVENIRNNLLETIGEICRGERRNADVAPVVPGKTPGSSDARPDAVIGRDERSQETHPLSHTQAYFWRQYQRSPQSPACAVACSVRVAFPFGISRVQAAVQKLVERHAMLRTTYDTQGNVPVMRVHRTSPVACELIDASGWDEAQLHREVHQRYREPFDLLRGPVLRVQLFSRAADDHILLLTAGHVACDERSLGMILKEFLDLASTDAEPGAPISPTSYVEFTAFQDRMLRGVEGEALLRFWTTRLAGELPRLDLPSTRQRPSTGALCGCTHRFSIPGELYRGIQSLASRSGVAAGAVLLASFQVLLMRYCAQEDVLLVMPMASRPRTEDESVVGCYSNPVVIREDVPACISFVELLRRTDKTVREAFEHRHYPFPLLVAKLGIPIEPDRSPISPVAFVLPGYPAAEDEPARSSPHGTGTRSGEDCMAGDPKVCAYPLDREDGQTELALSLADTGGSFSGLLHYHTALFEEAAMVRMAEQYQVLLQGIVSRPDQQLSALPLLTAAEKDRLLGEWNDTKVDYPQDDCIHDLFEARAKRTPHAVAVEFNGRHLSYAELDAQSSRFAEHLRSHGVGPDAVVALFVDRSLEMVIALLGVLKAGGAYLPLDRLFPRERLAFMLEDARPRVLVTTTNLVNELPAHEASVVCVDDFPRTAVAQPSAARPAPVDLAYILYTSGSTGRPKGVQVPHRAVINFLSSMRREPGMEAHDTLLSVTTMSFDILGLELWLPLTTGARVVLVPGDVAMDGKRLARSIASSKATVMQATPATWRLLLETGWEGSPRMKVLCGGEAWDGELAKALLPKCASLWNLYGPTETTIWSAVRRVRNGEPVTLGRPIANTRFYVVDPRLQPVPVGVPGELLIGGDGLARGYLNRPELTAERFIPDPVSPVAGSRVYRTGDLVRYLPDGQLAYIARLDQQVKIRGFRIELGEVEGALNALPGIRQAVVAVHEADGNRQLAAYIVPEESRVFSVSAARRELKKNLPDYMAPATFTLLEAFPLTPNGKIDRRSLPAPIGLRPEMDPAYVAPQSEIEKTIAAIWREMLPVDRVGVHDTFFDLGGNSLRMAQVHGRLCEQLHKEITMLELFTYPTISSLARHLCRTETGHCGVDIKDERLEKLKEGKDRLRLRSLHRAQADHRERSMRNEHVLEP